MDGATDVVSGVRDRGGEAGDDRSLVKRAGLVGIGGYVLKRGLDRRGLGGMLAAAVGGYTLYRVLRRNGPATHSGESAIADESVDRETRPETARPSVERSITVRESADELAALASDPETLDRLVGPFADVGRIDDSDERLRWTLAGPYGRTSTWEIELFAEQPGEFSRWRSTEGTYVPVEYSIAFDRAPADRGTEVTLRVWLDPPLGVLGTAVANRLLTRNALASAALYRLKSLAETGEIPTLEKNPSARGQGDLL